MIRSGVVPSFTTFDVSEMLDRGLPPTWIDGEVREIDHAAQVVTSPTQVDRLISAFDNRGAEIVEPPYLFPDGVCDDTLPWPLHKYMGTVRTARGLLVVSAPLVEGDQLSRHLARFGVGVPHHVAVPVPDIETATAAWQARGWSASTITDDGSLAQVFLFRPQTGQLVELISRKDPDDLATFSCGNVAALSQAEEAIRTEGRGP